MKTALDLFVKDGYPPADWHCVDQVTRNHYLLEAEKAEPPEESFDLSGGPIKSETVCEQ